MPEGGTGGERTVGLPADREEEDEEEEDKANGGAEGGWEDMDED